jgi:hypothetical protein
MTQTGGNFNRVSATQERTNPTIELASSSPGERVSLTGSVYMGSFRRGVSEFAEVRGEDGGKSNVLASRRLPLERIA